MQLGQEPYAQRAPVWVQGLAWAPLSCCREIRVTTDASESAVRETDIAEDGGVLAGALDSLGQGSVGTRGAAGQGCAGRGAAVPRARTGV